MRRTISLLRRGVTLPFSLLWKGYYGLWWAFGDDGHPPAEGPAAKVGTLDKTLKVGFGSTLAASALMGLVGASGASDGAFSSTTACVLWLWSTLLAGVVSIWAVKHVARQQAARNPAGWKAHAEAAAAGFRDMGREVAGAAVKARDATVNAGRHVGVAGKLVAQAGRVTRGYAQRLRSWVRPRPS